MADYKYPKPVKLIIPLLGKDQYHLDKITEILIQEFGPIETIMKSIRFEDTNYYEDEVGSTPIRTILGFQSLIQREDLVRIKRKTNEIERNTFENERYVNIDPGYLTMGQFFLATTKDQRQRVYVGDGIFIDPTLYYQNGSFQWYDWTYYDYRSPAYHEFLQTVRVNYHAQLKTLSRSS